MSYISKRLPRDMTARPETLVQLPDEDAAILKIARELVDICRSNAGARTAFYRGINAVVETGRLSGQKSLINLMFTLLDRLAAHLYSPTDIRFSMDFENEYGKEVKERARIVSRLLGRSWERKSSDIQFAQGVFESVKYGACFMKQWPIAVGVDKLPEYRSGLIMPWQMGVYRPDVADLDDQPCIVESNVMTLPEVWRRIMHMPDAIRLFDRIKQNSSTGEGSELENSFHHPVLFANQIQFSQPAKPLAGGLVQLGGWDGMDLARAESTAPKVTFHELWLWCKQDYVTIQFIEPDILIAPRFKVSNMLIPGQDSGLQPYNIIQPNQTHGNIWGRSELSDLMMTQDFLSQTAEDVRTMFGLQIDKILAITGDDITAEKYASMKASGYLNLGPGGSINDLTPAFPAQGIPLMDKLTQIIEMISGFDNLLSGKGENGVRSGMQSNALMKAAGARLKDRSLIVERQCAEIVDKRLSLMEAKDGRTYWTDAKHPEETQFLLSDLPDDRRVIVDGHTTSPIFADEYQQLIIGGLKMGIVDKESAIEALPLPNKDTLLQRLRDAQEKEAELMKQLQQNNPEGFAKAMEKKMGGGRR